MSKERGRVLRWAIRCQDGSWFDGTYGDEPRSKRRIYRTRAAAQARATRLGLSPFLFEIVKVRVLP